MGSFWRVFTVSSFSMQQRPVSGSFWQVLKSIPPCTSTPFWRPRLASLPPFLPCRGAAWSPSARATTASKTKAWKRNIWTLKNWRMCKSSSGGWSKLFSLFSLGRKQMQVQARERQVSWRKTERGIFKSKMSAQLELARLSVEKNSMPKIVRYLHLLPKVCFQLECWTTSDDEEPNIFAIYRLSSDTSLTTVATDAFLTQRRCRHDDDASRWRHDDSCVGESPRKWKPLNVRIFLTVWEKKIHINRGTREGLQLQNTDFNRCTRVCLVRCWSP